MKRFLSILFTTAILFTFCSCSNSTGQRESVPDPQTESGEHSFLLDNSAPNEKTADEDNNKEHTWSKDFDGVVLTAATDKAEYKLGEEIHLTTSVKNNSDETIYIYVHTDSPDTHQEIRTDMGHDGKSLHDPDMVYYYTFGTNIIELARGEEYVQEERRVTFIYNEYHAENEEAYELAPIGEYKCQSVFSQMDSPFPNSKMRARRLNYSITLTEPDEPVKPYRFSPRKNDKLSTSHDDGCFSLGAETEKTYYRPGESVTVEITFTPYNTDTELVSGSCVVYLYGESPFWVVPENIIDKRSFLEGVKIEQGGELKQSFTFDGLTEPGKYVFNYSADYRLPDGSIDNISSVIMPTVLAED